MLTQICNLQNEIGPLNYNWNCYTSGTTALSSVTLAIQKLIDQTCIRTALNLNWYCIPSGTTNSINDSLQAIINAENQQKISYASSQFVVSGSSSTCNQVLYLQQGQWVPFLPYKLNGTTTTPITKLGPSSSVNTVEVSNGFSLATSSINPQGSYSQPQMYAYLDSLGYVTIVGTFTIGRLISYDAGRGSYSVGSGITQAYMSSSTVGAFTNENGSGPIIMSNSGIYMHLFTMPTISGISYAPGIKGILGAAIGDRSEVTTCGYGVNYDNQYYYNPSGNPASGSSFAATYNTCLNYPTAYFPVYVTYIKNPSGGLNVYLQPSWNTPTNNINYKIPITLYIKFTFNINN
jgi:hypothetical protein